MTAKQALRAIVDAMSEDEAAELLGYPNMLSDPDELTEAELERLAKVREEMARGEYVTLEKLEA